MIGIGNPDRGDDAVGPLVAGGLAGSVPGDVPVLVRHGDLLSLIDDWAGFDGLVCVDAAAPRGRPGRISRIDLNSGELPRGGSPSSSHALDLAGTVELARALRLAPREIIVYAIEGCCFERGACVSAPVAAAAREVAELVGAEIARMRSLRRAAG
ncbi:MAG: hydrogenase maturation protease [Gammaproteobacteria bacterium]|nr:hydrogenase maturation protease [Gammaproteobacteria bacterium]